MTASQRRFLGRYNDVITRQAVYATDSALEVDEQDNFQIVRKRVFFEDVLLVTLHERVAILAILFCLGFGAFFVLIGAIAGGAGGWSLGGLGALFIGYGLMRISIKDSVVTVFGRRSRARIRFALRKGRAQRLYDEICANVRRAQLQLEQQQQLQEEPANDVDQDDSVREG
jgi:hypothetical protein